MKTKGGSAPYTSLNIFVKKDLVDFVSLVRHILLVKHLRNIIFKSVATKGGDAPAYNWQIGW